MGISDGSHGRSLCSIFSYLGTHWTASLQARSRACEARGACEASHLFTNRKMHLTMRTPSLTPKKTRTSVIERVQSRLGEIGFSIHDATTSWRMTNVKVDIFHFDLLSPSVCRRWRVPLGSFSLFPKCFFPALPSLSDSWEQCDASVPVPYPVPPIRAQLRWQVFKGIRQTSCPQQTVYGVTDEEGIVGRLADDITTAIDQKLVPFWSRYNDPFKLLQTLREEEDVIGWDWEGAVDIGSINSHIRLFYLGFAALWLEDHALAVSALTECRAHRKWQPLGIPGTFDSRPVLDCIDRGLARARKGLVAGRPLTAR
jgi:hypothetical protein